MKRIWLIRHGESVGNSGGETISAWDNPLTALGHKQANEVVQAFTEAPSLIVQSSYIRAQETAIPTIKQFQDVPVEEWAVHEFTHLNEEKYRGTTGQSRAPFMKEYWDRCDPHWLDGTGCETFANFIDRIHDFRNKIISRPEEFIAVFTHGYFMRTFIWVNLRDSIEMTPKTMAECWKFNSSFWTINGAILECQLDNKSNLFIGGMSTSHIS